MLGWVAEFIAGGVDVVIGPVAGYAPWYAESIEYVTDSITRVAEIFDQAIMKLLSG